MRYFLQIGESSVNNGSLHRIFSSSPRADLVDSSYTNSSFLLALEYSDLIHPTLFFSHGIGLDISESIKQFNCSFYKVELIFICLREFLILLGSFIFPSFHISERCFGQIRR